jgi:hypothetical protein
MRCHILHAMSLTPHVPCMQCQRHCMDHACSVNDTACSMHPVSITPMHRAPGVNDTACTVHARTACISKISFFSSRIQICMQKGFSPLIRGPGQMFKWKKRWSKISWHFPFKQIKLYSRINSVKLIFLRYSLLDLIEHTNNIRISDNIMLSDNM